MSSLSVWREYHGNLELVGSIASPSGSIEFAYDPSYEGQPISVLFLCAARPTRKPKPPGSSRPSFPKERHDWSLPGCSMRKRGRKRMAMWEVTNNMLNPTRFKRHPLALQIGGASARNPENFTPCKNARRQSFCV